MLNTFIHAEIIKQHRTHRFSIVNSRLDLHATDTQTAAETRSRVTRNPPEDGRTDGRRPSDGRTDGDRLTDAKL